MTTTTPPDQTLSPPWLKWLTGLTILISLSWLLLLFLPGLLPQGLWAAGDKAAWYLTRSSGLIAYLLVTASTLWGLLLSSKLIKDIIPPALALAMHNYLSWTAIGLSLVHALALLFDHYFTYTLADLLIPFTGPYKPLWVGPGTISLYLLIITSASFYARRWLGHKNWRRLHYLTFLAYTLITLHGWMAGTDNALLGPLYLSSALATFFLTLYRILATPAARPRRAPRR